MLSPARTTRPEPARARHHRVAAARPRPPPRTDRDRDDGARAQRTTAADRAAEYFANAATAADPVVVERAARYGIAEEASDRKWERFDKRFDMAQEPNEPNRFGWIVEVDPFDPKATPVKRTALGRFKHESATIGLTDDGRAVAYMGDDEVFDYVYKFVSDDKMKKGNSRRAREHNATLLDNGTL